MENKDEENKRLGYIHIFGSNFSHKDWVFSNDMQSDDTTVKGVVNQWRHGINSPRSEWSYRYNISPNFRKTGSNDAWVAEYIVTVDQGLEYITVAYGDTPQIALNSVIDVVATLKRMDFNE